jgi:hypothetical protein
MIILFAVPAMTIAESTKESAGSVILNKWLGIWKSHSIFKPSTWSLETKELSGTSKIEWILDGHFQQVSSQSGEHETRQINHYGVC